MNSSIRRRFIYPAIQLIRRENALQELPKVMKSEQFNRETLEKIQLNQLKSLVRHVYHNVPYYKTKFDKAHIYPGDIRTLKDFQNLPVLTREDLRNNMKRMIADNYKKAIESRKTSGSTGFPMDILKGRDSLSRMRAVMFRCYSWYGIDICDKQLRLTGEVINKLALAKSKVQDKLLNKLRISTMDLSEERLLRSLAKVEKFQPKYIYGYPSAIHNFGLFLNKVGFRKIFPKIIITTGECLKPQHREFIESFFECKVVNEYGCCECGIIAFECPHGYMHLSDDNLYVEIWKEQANSRSSEYTNDSGSVLISELYNFSIPLIRYQIGDLGRIEKHRACSCGRTFRILAEIKGRESEIIQLPNGGRVHSEIFDYLSDALDEKGLGVNEYRVIQRGSRDFEMELVCKHKKHKRIEQVQKFVDEILKKHLGSDISITYKYVQALRREPSGKFRCFVPLKEEAE